MNPTLASVYASNFESQRLNQDRLSYVKDRLSLIQAMLQQQRISAALSQIQNLKQKFPLQVLMDLNQVMLLFLQLNFIQILKLQMIQLKQLKMQMLL